MKGLPMGYSKDLQEDKEPLFDTYENVLLMIKVIRGIFEIYEISWAIALVIIAYIWVKKRKK